MNKAQSLVLALASVVALLATASPASAAPTSTADPSAKPEYCVVDVTNPQAPRKACSSTESGMAKAAKDQLGMNLAEYRTTPLTAAEQSRADQSRAAQKWTLGRVYEHADYGGSVYAFTAVNSNACGSGPINLSNLGAIGWDKRISSFKGNVCRARLNSGLSFSGSWYGPSWGTTFVGAAFNDKARSISWVS